MEILAIRDALTMFCQDWEFQLANLTRIAWTGDDGRCYFPYLPLTRPDYWMEHIFLSWIGERMYSWVAVENGRIVAHVALVWKKGYWELGRWVALPDAPRGAVTALCIEAMRYASAQGFRVQVECTQAHTRSQAICEKLGLRFAGIGVLDEIEGVTWDIIYFDNSSTMSFNPVVGVLGNPLGQEITCGPEHRRRLAQVEPILTSERLGTFPPQRFHILPHLLEIVRSIIRLNL